MKKLGGILRQKWLITLIGLLALSAIVWFAGPLIAISGSVPLASPIVRLLVIFALFLLWGLNNLRLQLKANKANNQLMEDLGGPPDQQDSFDDSQSKEEFELLRERFAQATDVLKNAKLGGGDASSRIYELPWYILIGPPGSGKTTALVNSDLQFPLADRFGKAGLQGIGGTRNCEWWFTNEAVLLDTAGRYTTQDTHESVDAAAWEGFLDLLRKHRRKRPINGVIVTISVSDLLQQTEYERGMNAQAIRRRVQELTEKFGISFPIYLMLSKADLLAGFMECFDDLGRDERSQVWGATFPMEASLEAEGLSQTFEQSFNGLLERLNQRILSRIHQERDAGRRSLILGFPQQLANLRPIVADFIEQAFRPSRYEDRALLRGVYFTSGTQEGTPIDRLMGSLSRTFGIDPRSSVAFSGPGKSFFLNRLFSDVIFPEAEITGTSRREERRSRLIHAASYAAAIVITVGSALGFAIAFTSNDSDIQLMEDRLAVFTGQSRVVARPGGSLIHKLPALASLRKTTEVFGDRSDRLPLLSDFGLYVGDNLGEAAENAYGRVLNATFFPHVLARLESRMSDGSRGLGPVYDALTTYLSLADPETMDRARLRKWAVADWRERFRRDARVQDQLSAHLDFVLAREIAPVALSRPHIRAAQRIVCRSLPEEQLLRRIYERIDAMGLAPFRLAAVGRTSYRVFASKSGRRDLSTISSRFTREGYDAFVRDGLPKIPAMYAEVRRVCALKRTLSPVVLAELRRKVENLYFTEYIRRWDSLAADITLVRFTDIAHAGQVLDTLSGPSSPLRDLLRAIERNTALGIQPGMGGKLAATGRAGAAAARAARAAADRAPGAAVRRKFRPLHVMVETVGDKPAPLDGLLADVAELRGYMVAIANAPDSGTAAIDAAKQRIQHQGKDLIGRVRDEARRQVTPVKQLLAAAARNSWATILGRSRVHLNAIWKGEVLPSYARLQGRFPLSRTSEREARLTDFARFFRPGGVLDQFVKDNLAPFVKTRGRWRLRPIDGLTLGIANDKLAQFRTARRIATALFPDGSQTPSVRFSIKPVVLDNRANRFTLTMDGQTITYRHGPVQPAAMVWPGPKRPGQVRMVFQNRSGSEQRSSIEGDWAWFRMLTPDKLVRTNSADRLRVNFKISNLSAVYEIRTDSLTNPFAAAAALFNFRAPRTL